MEKRIKLAQNIHPKRSGKVGDQPGVIKIPVDAVKPQINIYSYNEKELVTDKGTNIKVILDQLKKCKNHDHWIQIKGLGDAALLEDIGEHLKINPLVLEDIANVHQRPKFDEYDGYLFGVSRIIHYGRDKQLVNDQFSALIKDNLLITFEENHLEYFEAVKTRLAAGIGSMRKLGPSYMYYALTDTILDRYFELLAQIGESLDAVEDKLYRSADKTVMYETQQLKRAMIILRRASWPERDKFNEMLRSDNPLIDPGVKVYLRDAYDHVVQIMDMVENYKEISSSIMDIYLSMVSNRMNEIMKVLTIISAIFIPLTFVAGIYGMNFAKVDPVTNKVMPDNMPELYSPQGYYYVLAIMFLIAFVQIIIFWRKGWFSKL